MDNRADSLCIPLCMDTVVNGLHEREIGTKYPQTPPSANWSSPVMEARAQNVSTGICYRVSDSWIFLNNLLDMFIVVLKLSFRFQRVPTTLVGSQWFLNRLSNQSWATELARTSD